MLKANKTLFKQSKQKMNTYFSAFYSSMEQKFNQVIKG